MLNRIWYSLENILLLYKTGSKLSIKHRSNNKLSTYNCLCVYVGKKTRTKILKRFIQRSFSCRISMSNERCGIFNTITWDYDLIKIEHKPTKSFENMTKEFENENDTHKAKRQRKWKKKSLFSHIDHVRDLWPVHRLENKNSINISFAVEKENKK